jgi:hypothetical protein
VNNDQIKTLLLSLEEPPLDFTVVLSGKKSAKVNGLYKIEEREIILHNKNFTDDNLLIYTAIHEYAHHLQSCAHGGRISVRSHTTEFWARFHALLEKAEAQGLYSNAYASSDKLNELTTVIREKYMAQNGALFIELGQLLTQAHDLCGEAGLRFEDYIDRILCLPRVTAKMAMKSSAFNLNPALGSDNMRFLSGISNPVERHRAESALLAGKSPDTVKMTLRRGPGEENPRGQLEKEKNRLIRTIDSLSSRLKEVEQKLAEI